MAVYQQIGIDKLDIDFISLYRFVLIGLCWLYGRSEFPPAPPPIDVLASTLTFPYFHQLQGGGGNSLRSYSQQRPKRTNLSCCLGLIDNGQHREVGEAEEEEEKDYVHAMVGASTFALK